MAIRTSLFGLFVLAANIAYGEDFPSGPAGIWFDNQNGASVHISNDWALPGAASHNAWIEPGAKQFFEAPLGSSTKYFVGPVLNSRDPDTNEQRDHNTVVEVTYGNGVMFTYYDLDIEKGFSLPIWCHGSEDPWDDGQGCLEDVLSACPEADKHFDETTGIYDYCEAKNTTENFSIRAGLCPHIYVLFDDHQTKATNRKSHGILVLDLVYDWHSDLL